MWKTIGQLAAIPVGALNDLLRGYVIATLWAWFIVSQFPGTPKLSVVGALGLGIVVSMIKMRDFTAEEIRNVMSGKYTTLTLGESYFKSLMMAFLSLFMLLAGWIWHHFL